MSCNYYSGMCEKQCLKNEDCEGDNMKCDTFERIVSQESGICVPGKIQFHTSLV